VSEPAPEYYCPDCDVSFPVPPGTREPVLCSAWPSHPPMRLVEVKHVADTEHGQSGA
jgi:hypothetical protein